MKPSIGDYLFVFFIIVVIINYFNPFFIQNLFGKFTGILLWVAYIHILINSAVLGVAAMEGLLRAIPK